MSPGRPPSSDEDDDDDDYYFSSGFEEKSYARKVQLQAKPECKEDLFLKALKNIELETMKSMLAEGFSVDQALTSGWSSLMHACLLGSLPVVQFLVESGANVNFNKELFTPMMALCKSNSRKEDELLKCLNILIKHGANINAMDRHATTALMIASSAGYVELVKELLLRHCDVNIQDSEGWSALFHAVNDGREDIIRVLIDGKARLDLIDRRKRSAYDLAVSKGYDNLCTLVCSKKERRRLLEIEENLGVPSKIIRDPVEELFAQLPDSNTKSISGFSSDVEKLLQAMGLRHCVKLFIEHNFQLHEFLVITDERLKGLGVRFSVHRQRILSSVKKFHLHRWNKASLGMKPRNQQMDLGDGIKLLCNITKHLHVLSASLTYMQETQPITLKPEALKISENALHQLNLITNELKAIRLRAEYLSEKEKVEPVDLIRPKQEKNKCYYKSYYLPCIITSAFIGFFIWNRHTCR